RPPTLTVPADGNSSPAAILRHVVLPQPDGPTIATNSRSRTSNVTASSAGNMRPSRSKTRLTRSNRMSLTGIPREVETGSSGGKAAVDKDRLAGHVIRGAARKEDCGAGEIGELAVAADERA